MGIALSLVVGYVSSLLGIGGGIIHVPALVQLLNFPVHVATATSHFRLGWTASGWFPIFILLNSAFGQGFSQLEVGVFPSTSRLPRFCAWLLICLCIGQSLLLNMVLCVKADGRLAVEPAVGGRCSDLVQAVPVGEDFGAFVSTPTFCELCQDLPLASGTAYQLPPPVQTRVPLFAVPAMAVHPLLQPLAITSIRIEALAPPLPVPSSALIALRSTILLI